MKETRKKISECIRFYRKQKNYRQKDIAQFFGVAESTVSMWERGENMISADMFFELADFLGVSPDALAGRSPDGFSPGEVEMLRRFRALSDDAQVVIRNNIDLAFASSKKIDAVSA